MDFRPDISCYKKHKINLCLGMLFHWKTSLIFLNVDVQVSSLKIFCSIKQIYTPPSLYFKSNQAFRFILCFFHLLFLGFTDYLVLNLFYLHILHKFNLFVCCNELINFDVFCYISWCCYSKYKLKFNKSVKQPFFD